jgi:ATP-dependent helicase/DNAse subunit B
MTFSLLNLAPYREIASSIAERLAAARDGDPLSLWTEEVIVASNGVAQAISASLLEKLPHGFAALQLQSIETLATRIVNAAGEFPRVATDEERRLAMRTAARSLDDPLTSTRGAASMLERSYRDMRDSGLTLTDFSRRLGGARSLRNRERVKLALRAWQLYEKLIAKLGATDSADVLARAADLIRAGATVKPQIVAGFYDATGAQMAVLQALREVEKLVGVFVPVSEDEAFAQPFMRLFGASGLGPRASGSPRLLVRESATREEEVRDICARVAGLLASGVSPSSIGIVSRSLDAYDATLFARFAAEHEFCVSESPSVPLVAHRFARASVQLLRLRERNFPRADVLEIARSGIRLTTRPNLDKVDYETRRASVAGGRSADLRQRTFRSPVIDDYILIVEELESMTERIDSTWLPKLIQRMRAETSEDSAVIEELDKLAKLFQRADAWKRPLDQTSLLDALESAEKPRPEARGPGPVVWAGDVMRLRGRSFQHLFAFRMQDDVMPQRRVEDPLLTDADRRLLGIREIGDGRAEEQLLFGLMSAAADSVEFSFAASDGFGKPQRKSNFLRGLPMEDRQSCLSGQARLPVLHESPQRPLQLLARTGMRGVFDGYIQNDVVRERAIAALQSISPTHLEDFGECPQKFLLKQLLGVRDLDDPEMQMQIDHREKGTVDHRILERFYQAMDETALRDAMSALPMLPQSLVDTLDRIIDEEFELLEEKLPPFNAPVRNIEHQATRRVLRQFIALDLADLDAEDLMPRRFEEKFGPFVLEVDGTALKIEGKIDRIDEGTGRIRIVDYKSGKALRHVKLGDKIDRGVRLQLALYALAVNPRTEDRGPRTVSGAIKPIAGTGKLTEFSFELAEKESRLRETLALFVAAIRRGDFPAFPNEKDADYNACKYCPVNHSCRTRHDADEKRSVLRVSEPRALFEEPVA